MILKYIKINNLFKLFRSNNNTNSIQRRIHNVNNLTKNCEYEKNRRRVVITGIGIVSPIGINVKTAWENILQGNCGIRQLKESLYDKLPCRIAAKLSDDYNGLIYENFSKSDLRQMARATVFALYATNEALLMANLANFNGLNRERMGVAIGMGMIDLADVCETNDLLNDKGYNRVSPYFVPRILPNMTAGQISIKYGFHGPNHSVSTACATGAHSIGDSFRFIERSDADLMICGATESCISPLAIAGFCRLRALCTTYNDRPTEASRPFDDERNGFVMGEGAGILILEELKHAQKRNAPIIAEILGYGLSGDASHLTAPSENGYGAYLAMKRAIADAQLKSVNDIQYINAHATSTPIGDAIEIKAIRKLFENLTVSKTIAISSTKGHHGHLLGAAGNLELIFTALACRDGKLPPTINLVNSKNILQCTDPGLLNINLIANKAQDWTTQQDDRRIAIKNAFGFGGTNASLCISEFIE